MLVVFACPGTNLPLLMMLSRCCIWFNLDSIYYIADYTMYLLVVPKLHISFFIFIIGVKRTEPYTNNIVSMRNHHICM
jgi:hypothetical protein